MQTLTIRGPEDILASIPVLLGFHPQDSVVMLTLGQTQFHARTDLSVEQVEDLTRALLAPALKHTVPAVMFVAYGERDDASAVLDHLSRRFDDAGIDVIVTLVVADGMWYEPDGGVGRPLNLDTNEITATAAYNGDTPVSSRDALNERLKPAQEIEPQVMHNMDVWLPAIIDTALNGSPLTDDEIALLIGGLPRSTVRNEIQKILTRANARIMTDLFAQVTRHAAPRHRGWPAAMTALSAFLAGNGAMAWVAVDAGQEVDPDNKLTGLVEMCLRNAVSPDLWGQVSA